MAGKTIGMNAPIRLLLFAESSREQIEQLEMHKYREYLTDLPSKK